MNGNKRLIPSSFFDLVCLDICLQSRKSYDQNDKSLYTEYVPAVNDSSFKGKSTQFAIDAECPIRNLIADDVSFTFQMDKNCCM